MAKKKKNCVCLCICVFYMFLNKIIFTVHGCLLAIAVTMNVVLSVLLTQATANLVGASLLAIEPTSSWNNNETDKEIAFISVNGKLLSASNKATTETPQPYMNLTGSSVSTTTGGDTKPERLLRRGKRYLDFLNTSRMFVGTK